jgi:hypothetical protein
MKNLNPPNKISRTPKSKKDVEVKTVETPSSVERVEFNNKMPEIEPINHQRASAVEKNSTYKIADERIAEMARSLTDEEIAALAKHKGLSIKEEIKFVRHTFQVREDHLKKFQDYSLILGKKKKNIVSEALEDFFKKHEEEFRKVKSAKDAF